mmetsp:Transcript_10742/g.44772  ORF Transcript_10742/g.44772 Transcript_10742/m.44772 type:complete len:101 (+) Transcript_10742:2254-2556(+)
MVLGFTFPALAGSQNLRSASGGCFRPRECGINVKGCNKFPTDKHVLRGRSSLVVCLAGTEIGTDTEATSADQEEKPESCTYCHGKKLVECPVSAYSLGEI